MFISTLELRQYINPELPSESTFIVGQYNYDLGFKVNDEINILMTERELSSSIRTSTGQILPIKAKIIKRQFDVYSCDDEMIIQKAFKYYRLDSSIFKNVKNSGLIVLRIFAEAEDRDLLVKISQEIRQQNSLNLEN
jgi:hypothetical protein